MRRLALALFLPFGLSATLSSAFAFQTAGDDTLQAKLSDLRALVTSNRAALASYKWTEDTTVLLAGQVNASEPRLCRYRGGKVLKTLVVAPKDAPRDRPHGGLQSRAVEKIAAETRDYVARLEALIGDYLPPIPEKLRNASLANSPDDLSAVTINNYLKPGDKAIFSFDATAKKIRTVRIDTYLDDKTSDQILLTATFAALPDGTGYPAESDLKAVNRSIEIQTVSSHYEKIFP